MTSSVPGIIRNRSNCCCVHCRITGNFKNPSLRNCMLPSGRNEFYKGTIIFSRNEPDELIKLYS